MKRRDVKIYDYVIWRAVLAGILTTLVMWAVLAFVATLLVPGLGDLPTGDYVGGAIIILSLVAGAVVLYRSLRFPSDDEPVCQRCGYSLRGLPEPRCPECGEPFERPDQDVGK
jgi:hypothetical protein